MLDTVLLALQFRKRFVDAGLAEVINGQALNQLIFAGLAGHGKAKHRAFRYAVLAG